MTANELANELAPERAPERAPNARRRPEEVRVLLLAAAERLVVQKGASATALEIAREAGVHRSVLYRHFSGSEDLIREAALRPFNDFVEVFQTLTQGATGEPQALWDLLTTFLDRLFTSLSSHRDFLLALIADPNLIGPDHSEELRDEIDGVVERLARLNAAQGQLRGVDTAQMAIKTRLVLAMAAGLATYGDWLLPHGPDALTEAQVIDEIADLILYGVRTPDPRIVTADRLPPRGS